MSSGFSRSATARTPDRTMTVHAPPNRMRRSRRHESRVGGCTLDCGIDKVGSVRAELHVRYHLTVSVATSPSAGQHNTASTLGEVRVQRRVGVIGGANWYPVRNRNFRLNAQVIGIHRPPVGSVFGYYTGGQKGTTISLATGCCSDATAPLAAAFPKPGPRPRGARCAW